MYLTTQLDGDFILPRKGDKIVTQNPHLPKHEAPNILGVVDDAMWVLHEDEILIYVREVQSFD